ncbi:hypothetical protein E2C01_050120 [Portunus trituberculatus]|uniref:Uncharacterized protein n=1 Tax=Portunus trituberculatus TaxID=210409 RepID=A0A5B7GFU4_PORTR|nr:hypothetical protein [Portunus trituberculatus]
MSHAVHTVQAGLDAGLTCVAIQRPSLLEAEAAVLQAGSETEFLRVLLGPGSVSIIRPALGGEFLIVAMIR